MATASSSTSSSTMVDHISDLRSSLQNNESLEDVVLEKLDIFLSKLEAKLNYFESYFKNPINSKNSSNIDSKIDLIPDDQQHSFYNILLSIKNSVVSRKHVDNLHIILDKHFAESFPNDYNSIELENSNSNNSITDSSTPSGLTQRNINSNDKDNINSTSSLSSSSDFFSSFTSSSYSRSSSKSGNNNNSTNDNKDDNDLLQKDKMYQKLLNGLQYLDNKIEQFENTLNIPSSPADRLKKLKSTLYNYEKACVASKSRLLHFYELPLQWRENKYIIYGYRFSHSHTHALSGICTGHNETANIWTHLLGACFLFYLAFVHFPSTDVYNFTTDSDRLVLNIFFAAGAKCLLSSVIWHAYIGISKLTLRQRFACLDYTGITALITASIITTEHISLLQDPISRLSLITFSSIAGLFGVFFTTTAYFDKPESRPVRIMFFLALSGLGIGAFAFCGLFQGLGYALSLYFPLMKSFVFYLTGVVFYGTLIPEKWRYDVEIDEFDITDDTIMHLDKTNKLEEYLDKQPKLTESSHKLSSLWWVDYFLNSHNIWHIFVVGGIVGHYSAVLDMLRIVRMS
ncbi:unnamed protein product [[Candida] boidinii]|nr:hypothetical protein B5S30_g2094 [[Candida] boidinii]GMF49761.1 unnamed protein product [[Candida] boidinii]GMG13243.1 unnamed protein product [[Candida] boidinii]